MGLPSCESMHGNYSTNHYTYGRPSLCADWDVWACFVASIVAIPGVVLLMYGFYRQWCKHRNVAIVLGVAAAIFLLLTCLATVSFHDAVTMNLILFGPGVSAIAICLTNAYISTRIALWIHVSVYYETMGQEESLWKRCGLAYISVFITVADLALAVSPSVLATVYTAIDSGFVQEVAVFISCSLNIFFLLGGYIYLKLILKRDTGVHTRLFAESVWMAGCMFFFWCICRPILLFGDLPGSCLVAALSFIGTWVPFGYKTLRHMCNCESSECVLLETANQESIAKAQV